MALHGRCPIDLGRRRFIGIGLAGLLWAPRAGAQKHIVRTYLDDWIGGAVRLSDVTARVQAAAASGQSIRLRSGFECDLCRGIRFAQGTTFEGDGGRPAVFRLRTGAGELDASDFTEPALSPRRLGFLIEQVAGVRLFGIDVVTDAPSTPRTTIALALRQAQDCEIDSLRVSGFREQDGGYVRLDSVRDCLVRNVEVRDCLIATTALLKQQGTGVDVDNNRVRSGGRAVDSEGVRLIGITCEDLRMTPDAVRAYRFLQTDGVKLQGERSSVTISDLRVRNTGQALDIYASDCRANGVRATDIGLSPIKLIYGASRNEIRNVHCNGTGLAAVVIDARARTPTAPTARNNRVEVRAECVGKLWPKEVASSGVAQQAAFFINGEHEPIADRKPSGNEIVGWADGYVEGGRSFMPCVGFNQDAGVNRFEIGGTGYGERVFRSSGTAIPAFVPVGASK